MHSLRAFWNLLLPWPDAAFTLYILTAIGILIFAIACWRRPAPLEHRFAIMLLATVLVAPHLTVYDLVILTPGAAFDRRLAADSLRFAHRVASLFCMHLAVCGAALRAGRTCNSR